MSKFRDFYYRYKIKSQINGFDEKLSSEEFKVLFLSDDIFRKKWEEEINE